MSTRGRYLSTRLICAETAQKADAACGLLPVVLIDVLDREYVYDRLVIALLGAGLCDGWMCAHNLYDFRPSACEKGKGREYTGNLKFV